MAQSHVYQVEPSEHSRSLASFLRERGYSEKVLHRLKNAGVTVNGRCHRLIDPLAAGDLVEISLSERATDLIPNPNLAVEIVYEDDDLVVFNKPADMLIHPGAKGFDDALGNVFVARYPGATFRPLGRLDRNTTGLCLAAKNQPSANLLQHTIAKTYLAIVQGQLPQDHGTIDEPLLRIPGTPITYQVAASGLWAVTHYQVLRRLPRFTLLQAEILTGRTHQIRVHFAHLGFPLAGDALYGGSTQSIQRQALHCATMTFQHPITHQEIHLQCPLPADMQQLQETL